MSDGHGAHAPEIKADLQLSELVSHGYKSQQWLLDPNVPQHEKLVYVLNQGKAIQENGQIVQQARSAANRWQEDVKVNLAQKLGHIDEKGGVNEIGPDHYKTKIVDGDTDNSRHVQNALVDTALKYLEDWKEEDIESLKKDSKTEAGRKHILQRASKRLGLNARENESLLGLYDGVRGSEFAGQEIGEIYKILEKWTENSHDKVGQTWSNTHGVYINNALPEHGSLRREQNKTTFEKLLKPYIKDHSDSHVELADFSTIFNAATQSFYNNKVSEETAKAFGGKVAEPAPYAASTHADNHEAQHH